ncbi:MAG: hypothetical protein ACOY3J_11255 [Bacillota bacterium]
MKVVNQGSRDTKETFFGHGTFEIKAGETKNIPEEVYIIWKQPNFWGGGECPLISVEEIAEKKTAEKEPEKKLARKKEKEGEE